MSSNNAFLPTTLSSTLPHAAEGALCGKRLAVKDLFDISGLPTTAGNPTWARTHDIPTATNSSVEKLLLAGAEFVGKTLTDELAYSLNGQNIHYGTPVNPKAPDRLPGGSSSGSASAVASDLADIGLGTDTGGSIRVPASYNGLFGLRPTHGVIPTDNMVPLAPAFDTVGWMTRSLSDMRAVADVLLPNDSLQFDSPLLGILETTINACQHAKLIDDWLSNLFINKTSLTGFDPFTMGISDIFRILQGAQVWAQHGEWLIDNKPFIAADIQQRLDDCQRITPQQVLQAQVVQKHLIARIAELFTRCNILIIPTTPGIAPLLKTPAEQLAGYRKRLLALTAIAGLAGLPQLHLPLFYYNNAPCGLSLIGPRGADRFLISVAETLMERNT